MKVGRSLQGLAEEINRQMQTKRDFIVDTRAAEMIALRDEKSGLWSPKLTLKGESKPMVFGVTDICHEQIASKLGIPKGYYDRMRTISPDGLFLRNVNYWLIEQPRMHMIRTLDNNARAFLSDKYRRLDYFDLAECILPVLSAAGAKVASCELTEKRMYLKAFIPTMTAKIVGDVVRAGLVVTDSEVGLGAIGVDPMVEILSCTNGAICRDYGLRKTHIGRGWGGGDELFTDQAVELFSDETRAADDKAFWMKVRDVVKATLDEVLFRKIVGKWAEATERKIERDPIALVTEILPKKFGLGDEESKSVLRYLVEGKDLSQYGLANAVTRASQEVESYDRATEMERMGGQIIELSQGDWMTLATEPKKAKG